MRSFDFGVGRIRLGKGGVYQVSLGIARYILCYSCIQDIEENEVHLRYGYLEQTFF